MLTADEAKQLSTRTEDISPELHKMLKQIKLAVIIAEKIKEAAVAKESPAIEAPKAEPEPEPFKYATAAEIRVVTQAAISRKRGEVIEMLDKTGVLSEVYKKIHAAASEGGIHVDYNLGFMVGARSYAEMKDVGEILAGYLDKKGFGCVWNGPSCLQISWK